MPSLPKAQRRPWQAAPAKRVYEQHAARSPEYSTARWQRAREAQLKRCPCCAECTKQGRTTVATVCDHITPVRLGGAFYDPANHQSLCRPCHQRKSASEGREAARQTGTLPH
ncbi:HNH endonuclease [Hymenobacter cheonanensis]|uniref:HNH endonuclease n=1 Tax=Hymenobacter sp. CA2-7 TaxID=3063993 RepID=UPI002712715A|nr:HNH endonuclease signature motif containing protein [Hymenobacter sp. CA2-7]MDO7888274.1 HNH endonuclease signature motif containing protein [Hymenobacter sp. CA2-7]